MVEHTFVTQVLGSGVTGGTVDIVVLSGIPDKCIYTRHIVIENISGNGTVARVGVSRMGQFITLDYFAAFNQNVPQMSDDWPIPIYEYETLIVRITGASDAHVLNVNCSYQVYDLKEHAY